MKVLRSVALYVLIGGSFCGYCFGQSNKLSDFKKTDFLLTLEHDLNKERNSIYCASFLYAVDKIREGLKCPVPVNTGSRDLTLSLNSTFHQNTLRSGEYKSEVKIGKDRITAKASFQKSLPFKEKLFPGSGLQFNGRNVPSFEWFGEGGSVVQILYYNIERWFYEIPDYLPDCIAEFDTYRVDVFEHLDEQTFYRLKQLYENIDESTSLIIGYCHEIVSAELYGAVYKNGQSLYVLKKLITTMALENVPLPSIERFRKCEFKDGWGDVMDRTAVRA